MKKEHLNYFFIFGIIFLSLMIIGAGCASTQIKDIQENPEKYMGREVMVSGKVSNTFKIGEISGFTLVDDKYKMLVSSKELPAENKTVTVKGVVMKEILVGYYIYASEIY